MQADFNARFEATQKSRQSDVDRILDANNRIKEIWDEQARQGAATGEGALFKAQGGLDDGENSVLSVQVLILQLTHRPKVWTQSLEDEGHFDYCQQRVRYHH